MPRPIRTLLPLTLVPALLLAGCTERELPTAPLAPGTSSSLNTFDVGCGAGRVAELIAAINAANGDQSPDVIRLAPGCTYTLTNALPEVTSPIALDGAGATLERSSEPNTEAFSLLQVAAAGELIVDHLTLRNGMGWDYSGAIVNFGRAELHHCTLVANAGHVGGAVYNEISASLLIVGSTIRGNSAALGGGGIFNMGTLSIQGSTIQDNRLESVSLGAGWHGYGGGIYNRLRSAELSVENSTISGNESRGYGAGIANGGGRVTLRFVSVVDNRMLDTYDNLGNDIHDGGGLASIRVAGLESASFRVGATLVWGNRTADGLVRNVMASDDFVAFTSEGYNRIGASNPGALYGFGTEDFIPASLNPVEPLADNGGPTETHALTLVDARFTPIDAVPYGTLGCGTEVTTDQRGASRPHGSACDIGAFEYGASVPPPPPSYSFVGFTAPVENPGTLNVAKAGQTIPLKWRLLDGGGQPVLSLSGVTVKVENLSCNASSSTDPVGEYAAGKSGLQHLGEGFYQYNWSTPKSYAGSCRTLTLTLGNGIDLTRSAFFQFTR